MPITAYINKKLWKRGSLVAASTLNNLSGPVYGLLLSLLVIRLSSANLWGAVVEIMLIQGIANHIGLWGSKEYLLRSFSRKPAEIAQDWQQSLLNRAILLPAILLVVYQLLPDGQVSLLLCAWIALRFIYLSFDVLILFQKAFRFGLLLEMGGFLLTASLIYLQRGQLTALHVLQCFILTDILKTSVVSVFFSKQVFKKASLSFDFNYLKASFVFFLIGFSGLLQSRIDLICVAGLLPKEQLGFYQVLIGMLTYLQAGSYFIVSPFIKNMYRMPDELFGRISVRILGAGALMLLGGLPLMYILLSWLYHFHIDMSILIYSVLFVLPVFYYSPLVYRLYKNNHQDIVIGITLGGALFNLLMNLWLIPIMGLKGSLLATAAAQSLLALAYTWMKGKSQARNILFSTNINSNE